MGMSKRLILAESAEVMNYGASSFVQLLCKVRCFQIVKSND
jgi:hypothetical protein